MEEQRKQPAAPRGRSTASNPPNRFERLHVEADAAGLDAETMAASARARVPTQYFDDRSGSVLARNDSPDVPFTYSLNPYRGCEHGCIYCYARPSHELLGFSSGLDFETRIVVKRDAPALLEAALRSPRWQPQVVALCGNTDPYQPVERKLRLTRGCLEVFARFRNPVGVISKSALVLRDLDVLGEMARERLVTVTVSVTTLDVALAQAMEPRTSSPLRRLAAIEGLAAAGIPTQVNVAPVIPGLTEHELPAILRAAAERGAMSANMLLLRLPHQLKGLFEGWLQEHVPARAARVLNALRDVRGGALSDSRFGSRMRGEGPRAQAIATLFETSCRRLGLVHSLPELATDAFRVQHPRQTSLFD